MIGVLVKPSEAWAAEEFFQPFKTPWEIYREDHLYDVVLTTDDRLPTPLPRLLVIYSSRPKESEKADRITSSSDSQAVEFEYRKTSLPIYGPCLSFEAGASCTPVVTWRGQVTGFKVGIPGGKTLRLGYDLFREVEVLLSVGQPIEWARIPSFEIHIRILRDAILDASIPLLEVPPVPSGYRFQVCLTHDVDFAGIRFHRFDHSMWGFLYRSIIGGLRDILRRRISVDRLLRMWRAVLSLPLVYLGVAKDFWSPFEWYLRVEKGVPTTYFLIPFKNRPGERVRGKHPARRATKYDISDIPQWTTALRSAGCEIGVHGIDAWHNVEKGRDERDRIAILAQAQEVGVRMHWLLRDEGTYRVLDDACYAYDSTAGYNETIGYRCGTTQVFQPANTRRLMELPLHIQDGALFYPHQLGLTERQAWDLCKVMIEEVQKLGGVLTLLWHDRSHGPERFWGDFYVRLLETLRNSNVCFSTAAGVVQWFRQRREVRFLERRLENGSTEIMLSYPDRSIDPPLLIRLYHTRSDSEEHCGATATDYSWNGEGCLTFWRSSDTFAFEGSQPPVHAVDKERHKP